MQAAISIASETEIRRKVLLVDDEVVVRTVVAEFLRDADVEVYEAASADDAVAFIESGLDVDLVLTDVRMPGSMDGLELARYVRSRMPRVRVALTSANLAQWPSRELADAFFPKPTSLVTLVDRVLELLDEPRE